MKWWGEISYVDEPHFDYSMHAKGRKLLDEASRMEEIYIKNKFIIQDQIRKYFDTQEEERRK